MPITEPEAIDVLAERLAAECEGVAGHLTRREAMFLAVLASSTPGDGLILEIGSFKGKSTIILAKAERDTTGRRTLVAVDPLTSPAPTDPSLHGAASGRDEFFANLDRAGVRDRVEFHEKFSHELAAGWNRAIRLLWIDGDHTTEGVTNDVNLFGHFLQPGGVIAFHDVMHYSSVTRVFVERILRSGRFGAAGVVGSIGWAQALAPGQQDTFRKQRLALAEALTRHAAASDRGTGGPGQWRAKFERWRVPHATLNSRGYRALVGSAPSAT